MIMAFREKTAWLTLVCMGIAYTLYFGWVISVERGGEPPLTALLWRFGIITGVQAIVIVIATIALAASSGGEARAGADERDRAIARRGATIAYYMLLTGMIVVGVVMPFSETPWRIINTALFAIVLAETARYAIVILSYRRGWHG